MFTRMGEGTLLSYNNATEPFGYQAFKSFMPKGLLTRLYLSMGRFASDYYKRTVDGFLAISKTLEQAEIDADLERMLSQPDL